MADYVAHLGRLAVLAEDHVDTDRIVPARFLARVSRSGYGKLLFADVRGGDFALDQPEAEGATVLVVGSNFGCGSSREHAVWAIQQAGFHAVVAKRTPEVAGYSDIFRQNSANCGLLLIELDADSHAGLVQAGTGAEAVVDLVAQRIKFQGRALAFEIAPDLKQQMLEGRDLIGTTLEHESAIAAFEERDRTFVPPREVNV